MSYVCATHYCLGMRQVHEVHFELGYFSYGSCYGCVVRVKFMRCPLRIRSCSLPSAPHINVTAGLPQHRPTAWSREDRRRRHMFQTCSSSPDNAVAADTPEPCARLFHPSCPVHSDISCARLPPASCLLKKRIVASTSGPRASGVLGSEGLRDDGVMGMVPRQHNVRATAPRMRLRPPPP